MSQDAAQLATLLSSRAEEVCSLLIPGGKKKGNLWVAGDISGSPGDSLQIHLSGSRAGMWIDHASPENKGASLLWLWTKVKNLTFPQAIAEVKDYLGVKEENYAVARHLPKQFAKPIVKDVRLATPTSRAIDYITNVRKIPQHVLTANKIGETTDGNEIVFPFYESADPNEKAVHFKWLGVDRDEDGKKHIRSTKGTKRVLFGKRAIPDTAGYLVISEGEIDALTWQVSGFPAASVPNGVSDFDWIDLDWEYLSRFERIYLSYDMDGPGREAGEKAAKRLGLHRCFIVELPHKDANECLVEHAFTPADFQKALDESKQIEVEEIKTASNYADKVWDHFNPSNGLEGIETPWPQLLFRIRSGELTVWSGMSAHGKTACLNHLIIHSIYQGWKCMDLSLEVKPSKTIQGMVRCALGKDTPTNKEELKGCLNWLNDYLWFYDYVGTSSIDKIMETMRYAAKRYGINLFIIDSLFKCGISSEDYNGQRAFMDKLTSFCNDTGVHVILVAHSKKLESEGKVPTKSDISGSSDINNAAFNVLITWRDKNKKRVIDEAKALMNIHKQMEAEKWPDGIIRLDKERFGEGEDMDLRIYFDRISQQFHATQHHRVKYYEHKGVL